MYKVIWPYRRNSICWCRRIFVFVHVQLFEGRNIIFLDYIDILILVQIKPYEIN